jgi:superfamily II DNA or RNA helicase
LTLEHSHPEVGQIALVRDRHWVVADIMKGAEMADGTVHQGSAATQTLVDLTSVEDDGFGDDLNVLWELEPGARVLETATLPQPAVGQFDEPDRLDAFLDAVRWGAIQSADSRALQAPFRSGITIEDYQLDPVVRALQVPRVNLLIADDVGLGKTIEAGLVIQELLLRHRARTVLIVCPASLSLKWQTEMAEKFGLEFRIVDSEAVKNLRRERGVGTNIFSSFPRLIVSIDWLKRARAMALLDERLAGADPTRYPRAFDLLVIDEVHGCAPSGRGKYATDSQRTRAIRKIAPHFEHRLFLSATPHNGYSESFTALLELLDPQRFARGVQPSAENLKRVVVRRLKSELRAELLSKGGNPRFAERKLVPLEVDYPEAERQVHRWLAEYAESRRDGARSHTSRVATEFVAILLKKRLFSSPAAFLNTIDQHLVTLGRRQGALRADDALLRAAFDRLDEEIEDEDDLDEATEDALSTAARTMEPVTDHQKRLLSQMRAWAAREAGRPDAKARVLIEKLEEWCRPGGVWNDERVIVFTEYRDTQKWLLELLSAAQLAGDRGERVTLLFGGMDPEQRERTKAEFQAAPSRSPVRILLATDAASEGIDLQRHCHRMVHMEIPFSPSRLEQRNGRIDRHGQPAPEVLIHHFVGKGYEKAQPGSIEADLDFLSRVARKVETIRDELGSAGPVLAAEVEKAMLGYSANIETPEIEQRGRKARSTIARIERSLREEIARLREQLDESVETLGISPESIERVVRTGLEMGRQPGLAPAGTPGEFVVPRLTGSWARATIGLADPLDPAVVRPITFDHALAAGRDDVVLAHIGHRLVAQSMRLLRAEIWSTGPDLKLARVSARMARAGGLTDLAAIAHARIVITGGDGHRLHEEVITAGGSIRNGRFARLNVGETKAALEAGTSEAAPGFVCDELATSWSQFQDQLFRALEVRAQDVTTGLDRKFAARAEEEERNIREVLTELQRSIRQQLADLEKEQGMQLFLSGFEPGQLAGGEREQLQRDLDALRARVEEIPAEIEREVEVIRKRYANPQHRLFPAAVTFVVPESYARSLVR